MRAWDEMHGTSMMKMSQDELPMETCGKDLTT